MRCVLWAIILLAVVLSPPGAAAQISEPVVEPVLEEYGLSYGGNSGGSSPGVYATLFDESFGNGDAKAFLIFGSGAKASSLQLKVWRQLKPETTSFALLVFRVEVRGYDSEGSVVFSKDLRHFSFGDSQSGSWSKSFGRLPPSAVQIKVRFVGNYE